MIFKIFPATILTDGKKIPLVDKWQERATNDPVQIKTWQEQFGDRLKLWGIPTGSINNIYAFDIDNKNGVNGFEKLKKLGISQLPNTAYQYTPSGGLHLIFKNDPNLKLRNTANRELGCDTRAEGGWIGNYGIQNLQNICDIPSWVLEIVKKPINYIDPTQSNLVQLDPVLASQQFNAALVAVRNGQPGERNQTLNVQAFLVGKLVAAGAIPYDVAFAELTSAARDCGLEAHETQATILSGLKGGVAKPLTHPFGDKPPVPAIRIETPVPITETPSRWTPRFATIQEIFDWSKLKRPQLFQDWAPQDIILTSAIGGVGKTTIKLYESICLALGEPFLGFQCVTPGRTLFIIGEDSEAKLYAIIGRICHQMGLREPGQEHRLQAVLDNVVVKLADDVPLVAFNRQLNNYVVNVDSLIKIKEAIDDLQPKQIIFDPIGMFAGSEAGGNDSAKALAQAMHKIREMSDAAIDIISHIGKDSATKKDVGQFSARGATALANHSRVIRTLLKLNNEEYREIMHEDIPEGQTAIQCVVSKFSDGSPILDKPFVIIRDGFLFSRRDIPAAMMKDINENTSRDKQRIYEYIKMNSREDRPITEEVVVSHFYSQSPRITKAMTKSAITVLTFEGLIEKVSHIDTLVGEWLRARV